MKKSRFTEAEIIGVLHEQEAGGRALSGGLGYGCKAEGPGRQVHHRQRRVPA